MVKIAFINEDSFFRCGVASIIAVLKQHHTCELFVEKEEKNLLEAVKKFKPDILAFSCQSGEHLWVLKTAKKFKELNVPILLGGPHPTFFPEIIKEPVVDIVCIGEAEYAILELLDRLEKKQDITNIKNLWVKKNNKIYKNPVRNLIEDLDELPFMDRELCYDKYNSLEEEQAIHVLMTRGCPYNCSFCYNSKLKEMYKDKGTYLRQRSPENMIKEINLLVKKYPKANVIRFYDDDLCCNKKILYELLDLYKKKIEIPFICNLNVNSADEEVIKRLKDSGCDRICVGVESGNEDIRKKLLGKYVTNEQFIKVANFCHKYNLRLMGYNIIGIPEETVDNAIETIKLNHRMKVELALVNIFQPYPRTPIAEEMIKNGLIGKDYNVDSMTKYLHYTSVLKQKNIKQLCNLHMFFWFLVKYPIFIPIVRPLLKLPTTRFHYLFYYLPLMRRKIKYNSKGFMENTKLVLIRLWKTIVLGKMGLEEIGV